jgi:hypothetical protein
MCFASIAGRLLRVRCVRAILILALIVSGASCASSEDGAGDGEPFRYTYDFDGGPDEASITTSDTGSGRPFDTVFESHDSNVASYDIDGFVIDGDGAGRFTYDAPDDPFSAVGWDVPAGSEFYLRAIGRIDGSHSGAGFGFENDALDNNVFVAVDSGRSPYIAGQGLAHLAEAETTFFEDGDVFRVDMHVVADTNDGLVEARVWRNRISDADPFEVFGASGVDTGTEWTTVFYSTGAHVNAERTVWLDALEVNDIGWPSFDEDEA